MKIKRFRNQHLLFAAAFLLALAVRLVHLGRIPLSDGEAELALQALALARGEGMVTGPHPAYLALTSILMFLFGPGSWTARFWPALAGSLLVLVPLLFQHRTGRIPAAILAFLAVLDPILVASSRQAGSLSLALLFVPLAAGFWHRRRPALAGIFAGAALLSGPVAWPGILGLGAAALFVRWESRRKAPAAAGLGPAAPEQETLSNPPAQPGERDRSQRALWFALGTIFFAGTLFFTLPGGLSAAAGGLPAYWRAWTQPTGVPAWLVLLTLVLYGFFPLIFGLWGAVTGLLRGDLADRFLTVWLAVGLVLALAPAGRQAADIAWVVLPLLVMAARQLARLARVSAFDRGPVLGQALLTVLILGFISMTVASMANTFQNAAFNEYVFRLVGSAVMLMASTGLIAWGWSRFVALRGLAWGCAAILCVYAVASTWNVSGLSGRGNRELWAGNTSLVGADLIRKTIKDLDQWAPPEAGALDLAVADLPSPALRWVLRDTQRVTYSGVLAGDSSPALVITPVQEALELAAPYRGQALPVSETVDWSVLRRGDWLRWLIFRSVPAAAVQQSRMIVWARTDVFPGGAELEQSEP